MFIYFSFSLSNFNQTLQHCGTPLECYTDAISTLNQDRQEMKQTVQNLENKIKDLENEMSKRKVQVKKRSIVLVDKIIYNNITLTEFKIPNLSQKTFAIIIQVNFMSSNNAHGRGDLKGKFVQKDNIEVPDYQVPFNHQHYDWPRNTDIKDYIVPWDPTKGEFLSMIIELNRINDPDIKYSIIYVGEFTN